MTSLIQSLLQLQMFWFTHVFSPLCVMDQHKKAKFDITTHRTAALGRTSCWHPQRKSLLTTAALSMFGVIVLLVCSFHDSLHTVKAPSAKGGRTLKLQHAL